MRLAIIAVCLLALLVAAATSTKVEAYSCHQPVKRYYQAHYSNGVYYPAGYYVEHPKAQKVVFVELVPLPVYNAGYDPAGELKEEIQKLRKEILDLKKLSKAAEPRDIKALAERVVTMNCASCHTGDKAEKGFRIFAAPGTIDPGLDWFKVWERGDDGTMPPKPKESLGEEEVRILKERLKLSKKGG